MYIFVMILRGTECQTGRQFGFLLKIEKEILGVIYFVTYSSQSVVLCNFQASSCTERFVAETAVEEGYSPVLGCKTNSTLYMTHFLYYIISINSVLA